MTLIQGNRISRDLGFLKKKKKSDESPLNKDSLREIRTENSLEVQSYSFERDSTPDESFSV